MKSQHIICTVINDLTYDQRMQRICRSLAGAGYQVTLVGRQLPQSKPLRTEIFQQRRLRCWFNSGKFFYLEYNLRLLWLLFFARYDIHCAVDLDTLGAGFLATRFRKKALVYDAHEYFTEVPEVVERPRVQRLWRWLERQIVPRLRYAYTVCNSLAVLFEKEYDRPFEVIRNVPFRRPITAKEVAKPPVLLYQGALNDGRGLPEIIKAMSALPGVELWLAGEGDLSTSLRALVQELGVWDQVKFLGYLQPDELHQLTPKATLGLNLLENKGLSYYYSLANKSFDYIQAEVPALHPDFPEYRHLIDQFETGILVENLETTTLVEAIRRLLDDPAFYQHLQAECRKAAEIFIWETEEKKLLAFYEQVVN